MLQKTEMVKALEKAYFIARKNFEETLIYKANVIIRTNVKDSQTKVMKTVEKAIFTELPCRLSFYSSNNNDNGDTFSASTSMRLLVPHGTDIPANSKIELEQEGIRYILSNSKVLVHKTHFAYPVTEFTRWI